MRWLVSFLLVILLALLLAVALFISLPDLLRTPTEKLLPTLMQSAGLSEPNIKINRLSWQGIKIDSVSFRLKDKTQISAKNLSWQFSYSELMDSKFGKINLNHLSVTFANAQASSPDKALAKTNKENHQTKQNKVKAQEQKQAKTTKNAALKPVNPLLNFKAIEPIAYEIPNLKNLVPVHIDELKINEILLSHPQAKAKLRFFMKPKLFKINGELYPQAANAPLEIKAAFENFKQLKLSLFHKDKTYLELQAQIEQTPKQTKITLNQELKSWPKKLPESLKQLPLFIESQKLAGHIQLANKGFLPKDISFDLNTQLISKKAQATPSIMWFGGESNLQLTKPEFNSDIRLNLTQTKAKARIKPASPAKFKSLELQALLQKNTPIMQAKCAANLTQCQLDMTLSLNIKSSNQLKTNLNLAPSVYWQQNSGVKVKIPLNAKAGISMADIPVSQSQIKAEILAKLDSQGQWQVSFPQGIEQRVWTKKLGDWRLSKPLNISWLNNWSAKGQLGSLLAAQFNPLTLTLGSNHASNNKLSAKLKIRPTQLSCQPSGLNLASLQVSCNIGGGIYASSYGQWPVPEFLINSQISYDHGNQALSSSGEIKGINKKLMLNYKLAHKLKKQKGNVQFHLNDMPLNLSNLNLEQISKLTKLNLLNGYINGQGWLRYHKDKTSWQVNPDVMLVINQLAGVYDNSVAFEDWNLNLNLHRPNSKDYLVSANLRGKSVNTGVKIEQILASGKITIANSFKHFDAQIHQVNANLFSGRIYTPPFVYSSKQEVNSFSAVAQGLSVKEISKLSEAGDVKATGTLDGTIPITLRKNKPEVSDALFFARPPGGLIKVESAAGDSLKQSNAAVGFAFDALKNFHYDTLKVKANYMPTGELDMYLGFKGKNPDFFDGQATHLNVNLGYNLQDLLESLRITNRLIESIEEKYAPK